MNVNVFLAGAVLATSSLVFQTPNAQAQGRSPYRQSIGNYGQATQYYSYPSSRIVVHSYDNYSGRAYYPIANYSTGYRSYDIYGYPNQIRYSSGYGYRGGNNYQGVYTGYGYRSPSGLSIGIGISGFGSRGYLIPGNGTQAGLQRSRFGWSRR